MKSWLMLFLLLHCPALLAQGVYVTPGEKGPVFSDKAQPGAREVSLPPLNVMEPPPVAARPSARASPEDALPAYRSFSIVLPENDSGVTANDAVFAVRVAAEPPLQVAAGHAFAVTINGRSLGHRFTSTEFPIPREFWGDEPPPNNQRVDLEASIVDAQGRVLQSAAAVHFVLLHSFR